MKTMRRCVFMRVPLLCLLFSLAFLLPQLSSAQAAAGSGAAKLPFEPEMVQIKGGLFFMGAQEGLANEKPVHAVIVSDFEIGKYELTNDEFAAFIKDSGYVTLAEKTRAGRIGRDGGFGYYPGINWKEWNGPGSTLEGRGRMPVAQTSWDDAVAYAQWLSKKTGKKYRLPTEAEWEFACRAGSQTQFPWGDEFDQSKANTMGTWIKDPKEPFPAPGHTLTTVVDKYPPNAFGLHDMVGNMWEWVADNASDTYYQELARIKGPARDPKGPATSYNHAKSMRGGGWHAPAPRCRCAYRYTVDPPNYRSDHTGFRLVRTP